MAEAKAYLAHPVLGPRILECARTLTQLSGLSALQIFGSVDAQKLKSSMTLFARAAPDRSLFRDVLAQYFDGAGTKKRSDGSDPRSSALRADREDRPGAHDFFAVGPHGCVAERQSPGQLFDFRAHFEPHTGRAGTEVVRRQRNRGPHRRPVRFGADHAAERHVYQRR